MVRAMVKEGFSAPKPCPFCSVVPVKHDKVTFIVKHEMGCYMGDKYEKAQTYIFGNTGMKRWNTRDADQ
jgi:hypothetical protein